MMTRESLMRIGLAADHGGFALKTEMAEALLTAGHEVVDFGARSLTSGDDYPDDDNMNMLCMGGRVIGPALAWELVRNSSQVNVSGFTFFFAVWSAASTEAPSARLSIRALHTTAPITLFLFIPSETRLTQLNDASALGILSPLAMRFHVGAQDRPHFGLVAFPLAFEPVQEFFIHPQRHGSLRSRCDQLGRCPIGFQVAFVGIFGNDSLEFLLRRGSDLRPVGFAWERLQFFKRVCLDIYFFLHLLPSEMK